VASSVPPAAFFSPQVFGPWAEAELASPLPVEGFAVADVPPLEDFAAERVRDELIPDDYSAERQADDRFSPASE